MDQHSLIEHIRDERFQYYQVDHDVRFLEIAEFLGIVHYVRVDVDAGALHYDPRPAYERTLYLPHIAHTPEDHLQPVADHSRPDIRRDVVNLILERRVQNLLLRLQWCMHIFYSGIELCGSLSDIGDGNSD